LAGKKENEVALSRANMKIYRWMGSVKLTDRLRVGLEDIAAVLQHIR